MLSIGSVREARYLPAVPGGQFEAALSTDYGKKINTVTTGVPACYLRRLSAISGAHLGRSVPLRSPWGPMGGCGVWGPHAWGPMGSGGRTAPRVIAFLHGFLFILSSPIFLPKVWGVKTLGGQMFKVGGTTVRCDVAAYRRTISSSGSRGPGRGPGRSERATARSQSSHKTLN